MEIILQKDLPHQQTAIDSICQVFKDITFDAPEQFYANPQLPLYAPKIKENILAIQKQVPPTYASFCPPTEYLNLDIKMETGTGKTYVYTKTIFELHKQYGINKFIIVVPTLAIKAGTSQFILDKYSRKHFADACGYGSEIELGVLEASKNKKKGRSYFPSVVSDFVKGSHQNSKKIYVLLVNMQLLTSNQNKNGRDTGLLWRDDYDYGVEGFYRPFDAIAATKPFVIIDEPHRFSSEQKAFGVIAEQLKPQCILRFGATFPEITLGSGKNKSKQKEYKNLLYDLDACKAFNLNLIKGVAKEHFEPSSKRDEKVKISSIDSRDAVHFQHKKQGETTKNYTLKQNDSLSIISDAFEGVTISAIGKNYVEFSNGITKNVGEELEVSIYMTSYQEQMLKLAIHRHFETERANFCNRTFKIKTLALFFIDDIASYRDSKKEKTPYLRNTFERLLKKEMENVLASLTEYDAEYKAYLEASLADISACHAGYFAQDNEDSDEKIAREVDIILHDKKKLLSLKNENGSYNTLRFLFSKWTLKEGWDNPNVFTIAKLRSSGSENSKIQEVGRGLRLPIDENGNRIANGDFTLSYIVDFTEADFATRLVEQINSEIPDVLNISEEKLKAVAQKLKMSADDLFDILYTKKYIDRQQNIKIENREKFFAEYPDFAAGLSTGKVKDRNKEKPKQIQIRKAVYNELKALWEAINKRYLLFFENVDELNKNLEQKITSLLEEDIFTEQVMQSKREVLDSSADKMKVVSGTGVQYTVHRPLAYNGFLKRIAQATNIPITVLHAAMCNYANKHNGIQDKYINEDSVAAFCKQFTAWKIDNLVKNLSYRAGSSGIEATALTYKDGTPRGEIAQGRIGVYVEDGIPSEKYLYSAFAYDSQLELDNIKADIEEVVVYGKIPRNSIAIPTIMGGTYSPDFMYVVKGKDGSKVLNIVVETKDMKDKSSLRKEEEVKIQCAEKFFATLKINGYTVNFKSQLKNNQMKQIIQEVLAKNDNVV